MIILTGGIIGWYNYAQSSRIILAAADRVFGDLYREISTDLANGSRLNHTAIEMIADTGEALMENERIKAAYLGL